MMHRLTLVIAVALSLFFCSKSFADVLALETFDTIKKQLSYMKDVAAYKAKHRLPIEDIQQESIIIMQIKDQASKLGLDSVLIQRFFKTQIFVAKAIQYRYRKEWLVQPDLDINNNLELDEITPKLSKVREEVLVSISNKLRHSGTFNNDHYKLFMSTLQVKNLSKRDKMIMFESLKNVKLQQSLKQ